MATVAVVVALSLTGACAARWLTTKSSAQVPPTAAASPTPSGSATAPEGRDNGDTELLTALPYLSGIDPAPRRSGLVRGDSTATTGGYNVYSSGHGPEAILIDLKGTVLHRWSFPAEQAWPELVGSPYLENLKFWRRVRVLPNGDLLAIFDGFGLIRIDWNSRLLWAHHGGNHHHLDVAPDGQIYALARRARRFQDPGQAERLVIEDTIQVLTPDGQQINEISIPGCFERSDYAALLQSAKPSGDIFHTNTLRYLDGRGSSGMPAFRAGNLLISVRELNTISVLDPVERRVVWSMTGMWSRQHDPTILDNGHILLFDNRPEQGSSRVIEFDPLTQSIVWSYGGKADSDSHMFSATCGTVQRLPNGHTLIAESERGRAMVATPAGEIVWEYLNPGRAIGTDLIAVLFSMKRLPADFPVESWLKGCTTCG